MATAMAVLDGAIVNVALPTIAHDLSSRTPAPSGSSTPFSSRSRSRSCRCRRSATASATVASIGRGSPSSRWRPRLRPRPDLAVLAVARAVQGLGAAGIMSVNIALVRFIYPSSRLGRGVGNIALVVAVCSAGSPTVAAAILSVASWRWLFLINVPIGAAALVMAARNLPATPVRSAGSIRLSVVLNALTFGLLITGINGLGDATRTAPRSPSSSRPQRSGPFRPQAVEARDAVAAARPPEPAGVRAVARDVDLLLRRPEPRPRGAAVLFRGHAAPLRDRDRPPDDALAARHRPDCADRRTIGRPVRSRPARQRRAARHGGRDSRWSRSRGATPASASLVWRLAVCGLGFGFFQSPNNRLIIGSAPPERSGGASGLQSSGRLIGQSFGAALMAVAFGRSPEHATSIALWTAAGLSLAGACASGLRRA